MKRAYAGSQYGKLYEQYCRAEYPTEAEAIFQRASSYYREFEKDMPDLGKNLMAKNMLDWFTILSFYEASDHRLDGEVLLTIKRRQAEKMKLLGYLVNGNKQQWPYRVFARIYIRYSRALQAHLAKGEWTDSWRVELNPEHRTEGFSFRLIGCPIACHAKTHGYEALLPYLCRTDHFLAETMHTCLIRTQTEALGGACCDYWYVGDQSPTLEAYRDLKKI